MRSLRLSWRRAPEIRIRFSEKHTMCIWDKLSMCVYLFYDDCSRLVDPFWWRKYFNVNFTVPNNDELSNRFRF